MPRINRRLSEYAGLVTARETDRDGRSLDPVLITTLVTTLLPVIVDCFRKDEDVPPERVPDRVRELNSRAPRQLRKRLSRGITAERVEQHRQFCEEYRVRFRKRDALLPAAELNATVEAMIAEAVEMPESEAIELCRSIS